ncbi:hypothetical protein [Heliomarina baculiformis]|uniref:hypothetical protein n=1 Tax=Heliomarina baculiformis TaxID=2872036 RepID=UPI001EE16E37|nr:hypothetical protein [Heliomarina baculiformis]
MTAPTGSLETRLLEAHAQDDRTALVALYAEAADTANNPTASGFYLTHAYVYALETAHPLAEKLHSRLVAEGRDT